MLLVIDINEEDQIVNILDDNRPSIKKEEQKKEEIVIDLGKEIQKQVINIYGDIVPV